MRAWTTTFGFALVAFGLISLPVSAQMSEGGGGGDGGGGFWDDPEAWAQGWVDTLTRFVEREEQWVRDRTAPAEDEAGKQEENASAEANAASQEYSAHANATSENARKTLTDRTESGSEQAEEEKQDAERVIDEETPASDPEPPAQPLPSDEELPLPSRADHPGAPDVDKLFSELMVHPTRTSPCGDAASESSRSPDARIVAPTPRLRPTQGNPIEGCAPETLAPARSWYEPQAMNAVLPSPQGPVEAWIAIGILGLTLGGLLVALFWPLYARLPQDRVALHPRRAALIEAIRTQPGVHREALLRQFPMGRGALEHHLGKLVAAGVIAESRGPRYICYFVREGTDRRALGAAPILKAAGARRVLALLAARPHSAPEIATSTGLTVQTVRYHLIRLSEAELVKRESSLTAASYAVTDSGHTMIRGWTALLDSEPAGLQAVRA